jgi:cytosine/adenosine deaminase-related metal-dependent hydrolase
MIADGALAVRAQRIAAVGKTEALLRQYQSASLIDASGCLVLPGFIDAHNHPVHFLSRGISDDLPVHQRWATRVYPFELAANAQETYVGASANFCSMLKLGTTCFNDPGGYHADSVAQAALDSGIRGILTRSARDQTSEALALPTGADESTDAVLAAAVELYQRWHGAGEGRLRVWFSIRSVLNSSDELCRQAKRLADQHGVSLHAHLCVTPAENEHSLAQFGARSLGRFRRLGLLDGNLFLAHMGAVNAEEVRWLVEQAVKVCHCPSASMLGGLGCIAHGRFPEMLQAGVTVSLGTDAAAISRFLDMVRVMYLAANAHKDATADPTAIGCYKALEMATIDGARALGWDDQIGSLEPGKQADITIMAASGAEWYPRPLHNPVADLVYSADGKSVQTVLVAGKILVRDQQLTQVDEARLLQDANQAASAVLRKANITLRPAWPLE